MTMLRDIETRGPAAAEAKDVWAEAWQAADAEARSHGEGGSNMKRQCKLERGGFSALCFDFVLALFGLGLCMLTKPCARRRMDLDGLCRFAAASMVQDRRRHRLVSVGAIGASARYLQVLGLVSKLPWQRGMTK